MAHIFTSSLIIGIAFGANKLLALVRQYAIVSRFGFGTDIDAFNVANNLPDLIFSLFSGGALAMAFIPVFAEYITGSGRDFSWKLFSKVTTLICAITLVASAAIALLAPILVRSSWGVAPGFDPATQALVVDLLRINLLATIIFAVSGLVTSSLQAHKHFILPALAPLFYNLGIIVGALVFSPLWGIYGLTWGVVLGAAMHLLIQLPALKAHAFRFSFEGSLFDPGVKKIARLMGPRVLTVLLINITFLLRDNLASHLEAGSVTALTYGYFIMQVPETLIGTSIATALLPTLSSYASENKKKEFAQLLTISVRAMLAGSILPIALSFAALLPLIGTLFNFSSQESQLLVATTNAFMIGLLAQTLLEIFVRAFYAKQNPGIPLYTTLLRAIAFAALGFSLYRQTGVVGIAAIDSFAIALQVAVLGIILLPSLRPFVSILGTAGRSIIGAGIAFGITWASVLYVPAPIIIRVSLGVLIGSAVYLRCIKREIYLIKNV